MVAIDSTQEQIINLSANAFRVGFETVYGVGMEPGEVSWGDLAELIEGYLEQHGGDLNAAGSEMIALSYLGGRAVGTERSMDPQSEGSHAGREAYIVMCHELADWLNDEDEDHLEPDGGDEEEEDPDDADEETDDDE